MKQTFTMVAVAMMTAMSTMAQEELVIDSICTARPDGLRETKEIYVYNDLKQNTDIYNYYYFSLENNSIHLDEPLLVRRTHMTYNEFGVMQKEEEYSYEENSEGILTIVGEFSEWNEEAQQYEVIEIYRTDEFDPSSELQPTEYGIISKFHGTVGPEEITVYQMGDDGWEEFGTATYVYDDEGHTVKETLVLASSPAILVTSYEYDDHGNKTLMRFDTRMDILGSLTTIDYSETTYDNEYDDNGYLRQVTSRNGTYERIDTYYWGNGASVPTAIAQLASKSRQAMDRIATLGGQIVNGQPSRPGIYIVNGKKQVIK